MADMREVLPGIWHWTKPHPNLGGIRVSSYWLDEPGVLIDPLVPESGIDWFAARATPPTAIVLSNRHHYRDSEQFHQRFGIEIHVPKTGLHQFTDGQPVVGYDYAERLPGDLVAVEVGALSPDDSGLFLESAKALWLADTIVRGQESADEIGWVIDSLMDDPPETKRQLLTVFGELIERFDFEQLMLAHGRPLIGDGRVELQRLVDEGGRTAESAFSG